MSMFPIASQTIASSGTTSAITFTSIPQTFTHLQLRIFTSLSASNTGIGFNLNFDGGNNYARHAIVGNGSTALSFNTTTTSNMLLAFYTNTVATTSPLVAVVDFLDYANTNKYKTVRSLYGVDGNGVGETSLSSGLWMSTAAINTIQFGLGSPTYNAGSTFQLYGISTSNATGA